jgi:HEAT repeat protein
MNEYETNLQKEIKIYRGNRATLDQLRDLAANIGDQGCLAEAHILVELLHHPDEIVRYHATISLGFKLKFKDASSSFVKMMEADPDVDCRDAAAGALGVLWRDSRNNFIIEQLSRVALEDTNEDIQKAAYFALIIVNGISDGEYLQMLKHNRPSVDRYLVGGIRADAAKRRDQGTKCTEATPENSILG